ncbi:hypothetical protein NP233_g8817 [Leucocoprinus birnbaumii]|uniref:BED-type domain-containing protein n=1 Tax=Leucocoprinus birnbaumii TaxID=56174 RepID=A0AAD5VLK2_9AGAR|nr:hypothetical protein NP233_g8817 [Leucocoprinus birnbaumii]
MKPAMTKSRDAQDVWTFFEEEGSGRACKLCRDLKAKRPGHKVKVYARSTGTSILRRHLANAHLAIWAQELRRLELRAGGREAEALVDDYWVQNGEASSHSTSTGSDRPRFSKEAFLSALQEFVVSTNSALHMLEHPKFRALLLLLRQDLEDSEIPHRNFLRNRIMASFDEFLVHVKAELEKTLGKVSLTTDIWTDPNLTPYIGVTAHWIDVQHFNSPAGPRCLLSMKARVIGFRCIPGHHTGDHLAQALRFIVDRINITSKMGWTTMDNASNNDACMESFSQSLHPRIVFDPTEQRIRCFPHVVNLACQAVLSKITNIRLAENNAEDYNTVESSPRRDSIAILRTVIRTIRSSSLRRDGFSKTCIRLGLDDLQLIRDCITRWSSTQYMTQRALKLKPAIVQYLRLNPDMVRTPLLESDWETLEVYAKILAVPHAFQQVLSAEKTPTLCEVLPSFTAMIQAWQRLQVKFPAYSLIIEAGIAKLEQYQNRIKDIPAYTLAILINPAMKLDWFKENMPYDVEDTRDLFIWHLEPYHNDTSPAMATTAGLHTANVNAVDDDDDPCMILGLRNHQISRQRQNRSLHAEVEAYFLDTHVTTSSLMYWQDNYWRYPTIARLALDILPIQASSVPCERLFSTAKETMAPRRNRIAPELMEALQVLKYSYDHGGEELVFTAGLRRDEEIEYLMQIDHERASVPEDINLYIASLHATHIN